jgi:outer membrane receptor protein involved in Fe transport
MAGSASIANDCTERPASMEPGLKSRTARAAAARSACTKVACALLVAHGACAAWAASPGPGDTGDANPAEELERETVEIIGTSPAPGVARPIAAVPGNVQALTSGDLDRERSGGLATLLAREATGISLVAQQGNAFQPDLVYRGFTASPLLGTTQGLSVFQDGVRINDPFGERVLWDLVPTLAIANLQLLPGSTPAFGVNTLGGALALYTKSGSDQPGLAAQASAGSFRQRGLEAEYGAAQGHWDFYMAGSDTDAPGWAQHNASRVRLLFAKLGFQTRTVDLDLSYTGGDNRLAGTQLLPASWLATPAEAYTWPDQGSSRQQQLALKGSAQLAPGLLLGGTAYLRTLASNDLASNVNEDPALDPVTGEPTGGNAVNDRLGARTRGSGAALQLSWQGALAGRAHALVLALSHDRGDIRFSHEAQVATFAPDRQALGNGPYASLTALALGQQITSIVLGDTVTLAPRWSLDASARHTRALASSRDQSGLAPALDARQAFDEADGAAGLSWRATARSTVFATLSSGTRIPTPAELSCADPAAPCTLANSFVSDPPLHAVRARTLEFGLRGMLAGGYWRAAVFRTTLAHDILMVATASTAVTTGYFSNVGRTERAGFELGARREQGALLWQASLAGVRAQYLSPWQTSSPGNVAADSNGLISVQAGDRLPGVPSLSGRLRLAWRVRAAWQLGLEAQGQGSSWSRGDEDNRDPRGRLPGWAVLGFDAGWQPLPRLRLEAGMHNLFNRATVSAGALALDDFNGPGRSYSAANATYESFRSPSAPRSAWLEVHYGR